MAAGAKHKGRRLTDEHRRKIAEGMRLAVERKKAEEEAVRRGGAGGGVGEAGVPSARSQVQRTRDRGGGGTAASSGAGAIGGLRRRTVASALRPVARRQGAAELFTGEEDEEWAWTGEAKARAARAKAGAVAAASAAERREGAKARARQRALSASADVDALIGGDWSVGRDSRLGASVGLEWEAAAEGGDVDARGPHVPIPPPGRVDLEAEVVGVTLVRVATSSEAVLRWSVEERPRTACGGGAEGEGAGQTLRESVGEGIDGFHVHLVRLTDGCEGVDWIAARDGTDGAVSPTPTSPSGASSASASSSSSSSSSGSKLASDTCLGVVERELGVARLGVVLDEGGQPVGGSGGSGKGVVKAADGGVPTPYQWSASYSFVDGCVLDDLEPSTRYAVSVRCASELGTGAWCAPFQFVTRRRQAASTRAKLAEKATRRRHTAETRAKIGAGVKKHSEEARGSLEGVLRERLKAHQANLKRFQALRNELKPWCDATREAMKGLKRELSLADVRASRIAYLIERFEEYRDLRETLEEERVDLRGILDILEAQDANDDAGRARHEARVRGMQGIVGSITSGIPDYLGILGDEGGDEDGGGEAEGIYSL